MATTMNISLPEALRDFIESTVNAGGYSSVSEYMRELIRKDQERAVLREMLLGGARSEIVGHFGEDYFERLRQSVQRRT